MIDRFLRSTETTTRSEHPATISDEKLLFLGGLLGLSPSMRGRNGQPLAEAALVLLDEPTTPDFAADAEYIERELFLGE